MNNKKVSVHSHARKVYSIIQYYFLHNDNDINQSINQSINHESLSSRATATSRLNC